MMPALSSPVAREASVAIVGAGLSGLLTARELVAAGVDDVIVLEARDRVGGLLHEIRRSNGKVLMAGGEFTGPAQTQLLALLAEMEIAVQPLPAVADHESIGRFVRVFEGRRFVEAYPLESDPEAAAAYMAAMGRLDEMAAELPPDAPWTAPRAAEWDGQTFGQWLDANVSAPAARQQFAVDRAPLGDPAEVSLLHVLWFAGSHGGWEATNAVHERLVGGTAQIPRRIAEQLGDRVTLSSPVRLVEHGSDRVLVHHDGGIVAADAVVVTVEPAQAAKLQFTPRLPMARERLHARWLPAHGAKIYAVYERAFWKDEGLAGLAFGPQPFPLAADVSPDDGSEAILTALYGASATAAARYSEALSDPASAREVVLDALATYFGEQARDPVEFHMHDWTGDPWSTGCGSQLPPGVITSVGHALREPVGRVVWAGAETGAPPWMEGAVRSAHRAAREACALVRRRATR